MLESRTSLVQSTTKRAVELDDSRTDKEKHSDYAITRRLANMMRSLPNLFARLACLRFRTSLAVALKDQLIVY